VSKQLFFDVFFLYTAAIPHCFNSLSFFCFETKSRKHTRIQKAPDTGSAKKMDKKIKKIKKIKPGKE